MLEAISYDEYEKITRRESAHDILEFLKSTYEEKSQEKENQALMTSWEDLESSVTSSESDSDCALMARMADADITADSEDDAETFKSEEVESSESEEVFSKFTKSELADSLSEIIEKYNKLRVKYKKLQSTLVSETEPLKTELFELKEHNIKLSNVLEKAHENADSHKSSDDKNILNKYDYNFQKFLTNSLNRSHLAYIIYSVSRNNRCGVGYEPPFRETCKHPISVDEMIINYTPLYSHFKYGHSHDLKYTSSFEKFIKPLSQPKFRENFRQTNKSGPKKICVPKEKIAFDVGVLSCKEKLPSLENVKWRLSSNKGKKVYVQKGVT